MGQRGARHVERGAGDVHARATRVGAGEELAVSLPAPEPRIVLNVQASREVSSQETAKLMAANILRLLEHRGFHVEVEVYEAREVS